MYKQEFVKGKFGQRSRFVKVLYCDICHRKINWVVDRDGQHICEKCYKLATNGSSRSK